MAGVATMDQLLADSLSRSRFTMLLLGIFSAVALILASVGIYGLIAYSVTQRTQELGIRIALGAQRRDVLRLVLAQGTRLTLLGVALGVLAALALSRLLASMLFGVSVTDPLTFAGVAGLLASSLCWRASSPPAAPPASTPSSPCATNRSCRARLLRRAALLVLCDCRKGLLGVTNL